MEILYLCHCTPDAPDKGEKIRAYHELRYLGSRHDVHLACFARTRTEWEARANLAPICKTVYLERIRSSIRLPQAGMRFLAGESLVQAFYRSPRMRRHIGLLASSAGPDAVVAFSSVMASFAPAGLPLVVDMVDVDSEKWLSYARLRRPKAFYASEGRRFRNLEAELAGRAQTVLLSTANEEQLYRSFAPEAVTRVLENGVDTDYFDPGLFADRSEEKPSRTLVFVGAMDYYPNVDAVRWFASEVFPSARRLWPDVEFRIVGRNPAAEVRRLSRAEGVTVVGEVPDVRPHLAAATAVIAPLRIARGIQNKVLEALAMAKPVLASPEIARSFGARQPTGLLTCADASAYLDAFDKLDSLAPAPAAIRTDTCARFQWDRNVSLLEETLAAARIP